MISGIAHVCLGARDLEATEKYYCEGLGLEKKFEFRRDGKRVGFYLEIRKGCYIEVFQGDEFERIDRHPIRHVCLEVEDIDALREHLISQGIGVTEKKRGADQSWQVWSEDPTGVKIEFHQYTSESSQVTGKDCVLG